MSRGRPGASIIMGALAMSFRPELAHCPFCSSTDCLGSALWQAGGLCNSRRVEIGRAPPDDEPIVEEPPPLSPAQLLLFEARP